MDEKPVEMGIGEINKVTFEKGMLDNSTLRLPKPIALVATVIFDDGSSYQMSCAAKDEEGLKVTIENVKNGRNIHV